jgi:hypothetical protein
LFPVVAARREALPRSAAVWAQIALAALFAQGQPDEGDLHRSEFTIRNLDPQERGAPDEGQQGQAKARPSPPP